LDADHRTGTPVGAVAILGLFVTCSAHAGDLAAFVGGLQSGLSDDPTYAWEAEYRQPLTEHFVASVAWLNEGHPFNHHRDGQALQLWWSSQHDGSGLVLDAGFGPYWSYDSTRPPGSAGARDVHALGEVATVAADWNFHSGWFGSLRVNRVDVHGSFGTTALEAGGGYRFGQGLALPHLGSDASLDGDPPLFEIDALAGKTVANSIPAEAAFSEGVGVRAKLSNHFAVSMTYILGTNPPLAWRTGTAAQLWLEQQLARRFSVGIGVGAFVVTDRSPLANTNMPARLSGLVAIEGAYSISSRWLARMMWDRITTADDQDCDIVLVGFGYTF
jgi:hypothetical protein